ncbi:hypothetical protein BASA62_005189 [Batrachochytrium salamandrivorans]|nr:hypothetical protein BASA62_005189 [Batrachochytrium salamandrivorans]
MDFNGNTDNKRARMMDGEQVHNYFNPAAAAEWGFKPNRREQQPQYMTFANEREYNVFLEIEASHRRAELVANHVDKTKAVARAHEALIRAVAECASAELAAGDSYSPEEIKLGGGWGGSTSWSCPCNWRSSVASCTMQPPARSSAGSRISVGDNRNSRSDALGIFAEVSSNHNYSLTEL